MADSDIDLSICALATGGREALRPLLESIQGNIDALEFEVLVAEEGDQGIAPLADDFPGLTVLRLLGGLAPLERANRLLGLSQGRYLLLLPAGSLVEPHCLRRLVDFLDDNPEVGLVGPRLLDDKGCSVASGGVFPGLLALAGLPWPWPAPTFQRETGEVDLCQAGCHALRRELVDDIGLFRPGCGSLAELDLYWRARRAGWHAFHLREAAVSLTPTGRRQGFGHGQSGRFGELLAFLANRWLGWASLFIDKQRQ